MNNSIKMQLANIKRIMGKTNKIADVRLNFGKYEGKSLEYVVNRDEKYLEWVLTEDFISDRMRGYIEKAIS
jgi:uncharacterized protein (DUF3820 family)